MEDKHKKLMLKWYYRAQLDYFDRYINLFIAYNAWFKKTTDKNTDRDAINSLKLRSGIWNQFLDGTTMGSLAPYMCEIVELTRDSPLQNLTGNNTHWDGVVPDVTAWPSLIEFWYRVRCNLFHGAKTPEDPREARVVRLAYESLNVFMTEIVKRMDNAFDSQEIFRLYEIYKLQDSTRRELQTDSYHDYSAKNLDKTFLKAINKEEQQLMQRLETTKSIWEVDL